MRDKLWQRWEGIVEDDWVSNVRKVIWRQRWVGPLDTRNVRRVADSFVFLVGLMHWLTTAG